MVRDRDDMFEVWCRIIAEIRNHPVIYDKAHRNHCKLNVKDPILQGIADLINQEFGLDVDGKSLLSICHMFQWYDLESF